LSQAELQKHSKLKMRLTIATMIVAGFTLMSLFALISMGNSEVKGQFKIKYRTAPTIQNRKDLLILQPECTP